jgi:hypothetical protein
MKGELMLGLKKYIIGVVIGLLIGLWMGVNIGRDRALWANPFAEQNLAEKARDTASDVWKDAKKAAREKLED